MCRKLASLVAAVLVTLAVLPGAAHAFVYWTNSDAGTIGRANLDGTGIDQRYIAGASEPTGVAVDRAHVYWTNYGTNTIGRAKLDGRAVDQKFIVGARAPVGVAVDAAHVYWTNADTGTIGRAKLDGRAVDQRFIAGASGLRGVAVDAAHVFWANSATNSIARANLDGSGIDQSFIPGASDPYGVAVDRAHVYWTNADFAGGRIGRATLNGTGPDQSFALAAPLPRGVAVDANHIYWANYFTEQIGRARIDGTGADQSFIDHTVAPLGVAVDALKPTGTVSVSVQGSELVVRAGAGAKDNLAISRPSRFTLRVTDLPGGAFTGAVVHAGPGCTRGWDHTASCPAAGITPVLPVLVVSGDRSDRVVNSSGLPSSIYGEGGDDKLIGGTTYDILKGGPGSRRARGPGWQ